MLDSSEPIEVDDILVCILNEYMKIDDYQRSRLFRFQYFQ